MKINLRHATILGLVLIVAGAVIFLIKSSVLHYPLSPGERTTLWDFELYLEFEGRNEPARIEAYIPAGDVERAFPQEEFYNGSFGLSLIGENGTRNRKAVWTYRYPADKKVLRYAVQTLGETQSTPLPLAFRESEPQIIPFEADEVKRQAFIVWSGNLRQRSADDQSFADLALKSVFETRADNEQYADEVAALLDEGEGVVGRLVLAQQLLQSQGVPARIAGGVYLSDERRRLETRRWLEYHIDGEDFRFFPSDAPDRFFTIWYGPRPLVSADGVDDLDVQIALRSLDTSASAVAANTPGPLGDFGRAVGFGALPLTTQLVYQVLITIPVGITILVFLRQFIGFKTLGTFMPVLIGIAFRETALLNGVLLFTLLVALGLTLRFYLERLHLLLVPRLAVVLIFIVMTMAGITVLMTGANQAIGLSISLFPMVILTMTIERMSIVWEESSASEAIKQGFGSLAVAAITYLAMTNSYVEYLMYQFPELLLVLMGLCVLMGRYTGLRLMELWRFRALAN
ncbi:UUP1 family membrane protein [Hyphococcus flavus]|uniref:UUP1 family membrane protein n=1 Tax=Hyphococcus flavus TaxID=1866326 RepID=A0AAE9ZBT4_9PROT|nr:UUP1 family membrane protein [Hyphococcus flavus]WDI30455.1 UUP1 family membrane protein [Hyphococcus flavus]